MATCDITFVTELKPDGLYIKFCYHEKTYKSIVPPYFVLPIDNFNISDPIGFIQSCLIRAPFHHYEVIKNGDQFEILFSYQYECSCFCYKVLFHE